MNIYFWAIAFLILVPGIGTLFYRGYRSDQRRKVATKSGRQGGRRHGDGPKTHQL